MPNFWTFWRPKTDQFDKTKTIYTVPICPEKDTKFGRRLPTVFNTNGSIEVEDEVDWWDRKYAPERNGDPDGMTYQEIKEKRCGRRIIHPSCVPITIILILIFLVVLLPLLDRDGGTEPRKKVIVSNYVGTGKFSKGKSDGWKICDANCGFSLVESIPEKLVFSEGPTHLSTFDAWRWLIDSATSSIDMGVFYWTMTGKSTNTQGDLPQKGEEIFEKLKNVNATKVRFRIAQNNPTSSFPNTEAFEIPGAEVRNVDIAGLLGGVLHTKLWLVDGEHAYVGSANMDWRSLTQVKELGVLITDCPCMVKDLGKIFEIYWDLGRPGAVIPDEWPDELDTEYNMDRPMGIGVNGTSAAKISIGSSPPELCTRRRDTDLEQILRIIDSAKEFVYVAVMDYFPTSLYSKPGHYWDQIDTALRRAAFERGVQVRVLASIWNSTRPMLPRYLRSLKDLGPLEEGGLDVDAKLFRVPAFDPEQAQIPFARVNHNKYLVTDLTAFIGTSNWSEDYFTNTAGIGIAVTQESNVEVSIKRQLKEIFLRDWFSQFTENP